VLFLDEPTNGVDPVSRRDFWAILYQLVSEGLTVLVSTAYLDEAERANRVGMMHKGRLIRCDTPAVLKESLEETCYRVHFAHAEEARPLLERQPGVLGVYHAGIEYHLFVDERVTKVEDLLKLTAFTYQRIVPSLEDVFIALERKEEVAHAAA
jgi:ABC-2 type transport system ATP-binding protein